MGSLGPMAWPQLRRHPDASPSESSPDHHDLQVHYQCGPTPGPTRELEIGLWVVTAWISPPPAGPFRPVEALEANGNLQVRYQKSDGRSASAAAT